MSSKIFDKSKFFENITALRKEKGWTQNRLGEETGMSSPFMTNMKQGSMPSSRFLINLFDIFSTKEKMLSPMWLFFNIGPRYIAVEESNFDKDTIAALDENATDLEKLFFRIEKLDPQKQQALIQMIEGMTSLLKIS